MSQRHGQLQRVQHQYYFGAPIATVAEKFRRAQPVLAARQRRIWVQYVFPWGVGDRWRRPTRRCLQYCIPAWTYDGVPSPNAAFQRSFVRKKSKCTVGDFAYGRGQVGSV